MTIVVAALGSKGDLHPLLAIARALHEQGHPVVFLSQEPHRSEVETQGVVFEAVATVRDHQRTMAHPDLWHPIRGFGVLWRHLAVPAIGSTVDALERLSAESAAPLKVLASPLAIGARLAAEVLPIRLTTAHTAPSGLRSMTSPMFIGPWAIPAWVPRSVKSALWRALDAYKLDPMARPALNGWRERHGLPPITGSIFGAWLHDRGDILGLFPDSFGPVSADWPARTALCGFPLYEPGALADDAELGAFCTRQDGPLLVWYPGSTATPQQDLMHSAALRLSQQGLRSLWLQGTWPGPERVPPTNCLQRSSVCLPDVLSHARLFIHHGGIGATAQGLASGVEQLIQPSAYDQFENQWRLAAAVGENAPRPAAALSADELLGRIRSKLAGSNRAAIRSDPARYSWPGSPNPAVTAAIRQLLR